MSRKKFCLLTMALIVCCAIFSCNNKETKTAVSTDSALTGAGKRDLHDPPRAFGGYLDTLYIDSLHFSYLDTGSNKYNVVMQFTFGTAVTPMLHGWNVIKKAGIDSFKTNPDIKLLNGKQSTLSFGPDTYFGNEVLDRKDIKTILKQLNKNKSQYVVFFPVKKYEHISYDIYTLKGTYSQLKIDTINFLFADRTNTSLNPSPPRRYTFQ